MPKNAAKLIPGPAGDIEILFSPASQETRQTLVVICHPHPLYGGSMDNKVVHTLDRSLNKSGRSTVRFNFRGVGNSAGTYDEGQGEVDDLIAVCEWARAQRPDYKLWLAGFSFGSYIAIKAQTQLQPQQLITVAPPVNIFDLSQASQPSCPWLLIQGLEDEIVDAGQVLEWAAQFDSLTLATVPETGHFFHGKLNYLDAILTEKLPV